MHKLEEVEELLLMFIKDGYSQSGKISKKTALKMMHFVSKDENLQSAVNNNHGITKCKLRIKE